MLLQIGTGVDSAQPKLSVRWTLSLLLGLALDKDKSHVLMCPKMWSQGNQFILFNYLRFII